MNLAQIIRKSRLGCDAILPGNVPSQLWQDDELVDLVNEGNDTLNLHLRLAKKNYGHQTVKYGDAAFSRAGIDYNPSVSLLVSPGDTELELPPDFSEISRILCLSDRTVRWSPSDLNSAYYISAEQDASQDGSAIDEGTEDTVMFYDVADERTLVFTPPSPGEMQLQVEYTPVKRPLFYSKNGTVTLVQGSATVLGVGTTWVDDNVYSRSSGQRAELIVGANTLAHSKITLDKEFPRVASITDNGHLTLERTYTGASATGSAAIVAMCPTAPVDYHRWLASYISALMLRKVSPDLSGKYAGDVLKAFTTTVQPSSKSRQSQESKVTDDNELMGGLGDA